MNKKQPIDTDQPATITAEQERILENLGEAAHFLRVFDGPGSLQLARDNMRDWLDLHWDGLPAELQFYLAAVSSMPARVNFRVGASWSRCTEAARARMATSVRGALGWAEQVVEAAPMALEKAAKRIELGAVA